MDPISELDLVLIFLSSVLSILLAVSEWLADTRRLDANSITQLIRRSTTLATQTTQ